MSEPERPFLPMSGELGGDFMSEMADSIRERRAREVPGWKEGVETTKEWPEEEWEDEDEEWEEQLKTLFKKALGPLIDFVVDVTAMATIPAAILLMATAYQTTFGMLETALLLWSGTAVTLMIANAKTRLLQRLRLRLR